MCPQRAVTQICRSQQAQIGVLLSPPVWASHYNKGIEVEEHVHQRTMMLAKGLYHKSDEEAQMELRLFSLEKIGSRETLSLSTTA